MIEVNQVKELAHEYAPEGVENRRHLHAHPELSFQEEQTAAFVAEKLRGMGLEPQENIGGYGLSAIISGANCSQSDQVIGLRADMDALPIVELNEVAYKSKVEGVMHACGHDVHTSSLLGTAQILTQLKEELVRPVKLVFQPAEEKAPGGASIMIKDGILEQPTVAQMIGQHVAPNIPVGKIGFREGMYMASTDEIFLTVKGKGGHGAAPNHCIDPILIASHIIVALQQIVSRNRKPTNPSVLTFGKIQGLGATNVIPNEVKIDGTFRNMDEEWRAEGLTKIKKMAETLAESMGGTCEVNVVKGYPFLQNHPELTRQVRASSEAYMGKENIVDLDLWMAGEDFAYYSQVVDSCFYRLGTRNEAKGITSGVHTPNFNIDEGALEIGMGLMAWNALQQ